MRSAWTNAMKNRHKGWLKNAREWAEEQAYNVDGIQWDKEDMAVIRGHHPPWIPEPFWHRMIDQVFFSLFWVCALPLFYTDLYVMVLTGVE